MKELRCQPYHVNEDILGIITLKGKNLFQRKNFILVKENLSSPCSGYLATISTVLLKDKGIGGTVSDISGFNEGDVVMMDKDGEIIFLYEINSAHNSIFVTGKCNHRCIMCPQPPVASEPDRMPFNMRLISLIDKNTCELGITGGEPTMAGDNLFTLIRQIQKNLPKAAVSLLSNGVMFSDKEYAKKLALCNHFDLQVDVPVFSDIAEIHNKIVGAKTFYKTVQGLYNLALFHVQIGLRIVVHRKTYSRLPQLADFIFHNFPFVAQVAFLQMETTGIAKKNLDELWIDPYDYNQQLRDAVLLLNDRGIRTYIYNAQLCVLPEDIRNYAVNSISDWKDTFLPVCANCSLMKQCGGMFSTNQQHISSHVHSL